MKYINMLSENNNQICKTSNFEKTKLVLITGFLGSGKTTLLSKIINSKIDMADTVVIINEFGKIGIDSLLLEDKKTNVVELNSGCVCCSMLLDFNVTLQRVILKYSPKWIFVEASGVADTNNLLHALNTENLCNKIIVAQIITVVDSTSWPMRKLFGNIYLSQIRAASTILVNKCDLLSKKIVKNYIDEITADNDKARIIPTINCQIEFSTVWEKKQIDNIKHDEKDCLKIIKNNWSTYELDSSVEYAKPETKIAMDTIHFKTLLKVDKKKFIYTLKKLSFNIFRVKGIVCFQKECTIINWVKGDGHWTPWFGKPETNIVIIGWYLDQIKINYLFRKCLV